MDAADKFVPIQLCTDLLTYEGPETIELTLSNVQGGAAPGSQVTHTLTINDLGARFFNSDPISITGGPASPYPSDINGRRNAGYDNGGKGNAAECDAHIS